MKKQKKIFITIILLIILILSLSEKSYAKSTLKKVEHSENFNKWIELPKEEREKISQPRMYDIPFTNNTSKNPFYRTNILRSSINPRFSLKDIIPNNLIIKDQKSTGSCWAFAAISSLETTIALSNYKKGTNQSKTYDFSERHMNYATSRVFENNVINPDGYNRNPEDGGNWYLAHSYLTNGLGAIEEAEMPFEDNENIINISQIQNKTVTSQVSDIIEFPDYQMAIGEQKVQIMNQLKQHIQNYGAIFAPLHGDNSSIFSGSCYNNETAAKYCNFPLSHPIDHAISIIGWDDNYSINNFVEGARPRSNGAWIVRNSWGEKLEYDLSDLKNKIFTTYNSECISNGWNTASSIPNEFIQQLGYTIENNKAYSKIGDNGIIYVSYEDVNISQNMVGIQKATDKTNYDHIYQYDYYYPSQEIQMDNSSIILCNIFNKTTNGTEYLNQISLYNCQTYNCKVYINPNGTGKTKDDLQLVTLKSGESVTVPQGYHTLEFEKPIELKSDSFAVAIELTDPNDENVIFATESPTDLIDDFNVVQVEEGKCFTTSKIGFERNEDWYDLSKLSSENASLLDGDSTIKAFTVSQTSEIVDDSLKNIEIITPPNKTNYIEGDNFDKTGMVVKAYFNNNTSTILDDSNYEILNGTDLKFNQESVTIKYNDKTITQPISVEKNTITELKIKTPPTKTNYKEGQNFDKTGMIIEATYKNNSTKTISDYTIVDGNNLKIDQTQVTISYEGKTVKQQISVTPNALIEITIQKAPNKTKYIIGQNFDTTGMIIIGKFEDNSTEEILNYTIENGTNLKKDQTTVTIKYQDKTVTQSISVEEKTATSLTIIKNPTKLTYIQNTENLDLTGGSIKVTYNDGSTENIDLTSNDLTVTGFNNKTLGKISITIAYQSISTQLEIEIVKPQDTDDDKDDNDNTDNEDNEDNDNENTDKDDNEDKDDSKAQNSDLNNIKCDIKNAQGYFFTNNTQKDYILINVEIDNIIKNLNNDKLEYYYYLSSNANEQNINNWTKISEAQNSNNKLQFLIDSRNITNYNEISDKDVIYLYVKEVAIKGGNQSISVSKPMKLETDKNIEIFVDNNKINNIDSSTNNSSGDTSFKDKTTANGKLPNAGIKFTIIIAIVALLCIGIFLFIRYKKLSKYVK